MEQRIPPNIRLAIIPSTRPTGTGFARRSGPRTGLGPPVAILRGSTSSIARLRLASHSPTSTSSCGLQHPAPPWPRILADAGNNSCRFSTPAATAISQRPTLLPQTFNVNQSRIVTSLSEPQSTYFVNIDDTMGLLKIGVHPGKKHIHIPQTMPGILKFLEERRLYNRQLHKAHWTQYTSENISEMCQGGAIYTIDNDTKLIVKRTPGRSAGMGRGIQVAGGPIRRNVQLVNRSIPGTGRGRIPHHIPSFRLQASTPTTQQKMLPMANYATKHETGPSKPVEVINLDSDEDSEDDDDNEDENSEDEDEEDDGDYLEPEPFMKSLVSSAPKILANLPVSMSKVQVVQTQPVLDIRNTSRVIKQAPVVPKRQPRKTNPTATVSTPITPKSVTTTLQTETSTIQKSLESVVRGRNGRLPSKTIVAATKALSCLYRIPDLNKFRETHSMAQYTYGIHPFLEDRFIVFNFKDKDNDVENKVSDENRTPNNKSGVEQRRKRCDSPVSGIQAIKLLKKTESDDSSSEPRSLRRRGRPPLTTVVPTPPPTAPTMIQNTIKAAEKGTFTANSTRKTRATREISLTPDADSSEDEKNAGPSSNSSDDDSSSDSDDDSDSSNESQTNDNKNRTVDKASDSDESGKDGMRLRRSKRVVNVKGTGNKKARVKKQEVYKPPPTCFAEAKPSKPIRRAPDGRIYFSLNAKLSPSEYYKNEDLFVNWEKFVRNESEVAHYYKTMLMQTLLTSLVIYHMERRNETLQLDRSVELVSDGTIKVMLQSRNVTNEFMRYVNVETNTHLSSLLVNLINSNLCPGCPNFSSISVFPDAIFRDDIWFSTKCSQVVFNDPDNFTHSIPSGYHYSSYSNDNQMCPACKELRKRLEMEKAEMLKLNSRFKVKSESQSQNQNQRKGRGRANQQHQVIYAKYKPPQVEQMQVRKALSDLFIDFWKELGFKEEEFPKQTTDIQVDVVTEKDFPIVKEVDEDKDLIENQNNQSDPDPVGCANINPLMDLPLPPPLQLMDSIPIIENIDIDENGQTFLTYSDIQLNPCEMQNIHIMNMNMPEFSSEMIGSLMNSSDPEAILQTLTGIGTCTTVSVPGTGSGGESQIQSSQNEMNENPSGSLILASNTQNLQSLQNIPITNLQNPHMLDQNQHPHHVQDYHDQDQHVQQMEMPLGTEIGLQISQSQSGFNINTDGCITITTSSHQHPLPHISQHQDSLYHHQPEFHELQQMEIDANPIVYEHENQNEDIPQMPFFPTFSLTDDL